MLNKKEKIILGVIVAILIFALGNAIKENISKKIISNDKPKVLNSSKKTSTDNDALTSVDKKLLKKSYKDFDVNDRTEFSEIEQEKVNKLSSSEKADYDRLEKEKTEVEAEWEKQEEDKKKQQQAKNNKDFNAGEYTVGTHLDSGVYDITFNGDGNFNAYDKDGNLLINEIGGSNGIDKYRAIFTDGSKFKAQGMGFHTTPVNRTLLPYANFSLYAGYWVVGQDVTEGRYNVSTSSGNGNFIIYSSDSVPKTNEILGDNGVKNVTVDLSNGDIINISSLNQINFVPVN